MHRLGGPSSSNYRTSEPCWLQSKLGVHRGASLSLLFNLQEAELGLTVSLPLAWGPLTRGLALPIARNFNSSIKNKSTVQPD